MCLDKLKKFKTSGTGYKSMLVREKRLFSPCVMFPFIRNKWITDTSGGKLSAGRGIYPTGFHIFTNEKDAATYWNLGPSVVVKCEYQDVLATGIQDKRKVVVARRIKILK